MTAGVQLTAAASKLARKGHPWFYADDLQQAACADGDIVRVKSAEGRDLGLGFFTTRSQIRLRLCGPWPGEGVPPPEEFFGARLRQAIAHRGALSGPRAGLRLVHGEADGLPGLVVDRYAEAVVLQATTWTLERHLDALVPALVEYTEARAVLARHDVKIRQLEGLPLEVRLVHGRRLEQVEIEEHGLVHTVRLFAGHKTGFYLDQRPARAAVKALARDRRVLDLFSYQGAFAVAALAGGAVSALAIDQSAAALAAAQQAAARNGLTGLETRDGNVFDALRELRAGEARFDLVIVDPPAFAKAKAHRATALRAYRDLNRNALRLLAPRGCLVTCTCSHHVSRPMFEDLLRQGAADLPFRVVLRERLGAGIDHPVWISLPESEYLKVCVLERYD